MSEFSYDVLPYTSYPFEQSTPEHLASIARLFGLQTADFRSARVLELGCSSGGNILPLAELYPEASFVGVDLSEKELEEGRAQIDATGLSNARLLHMSVNDITAELGEFDFIIAHGLHSWVPEDTQGHIMRVCKENLAPKGIAYVSYNTLPGWNLVNSVRDMMRYHTRGLSDPASRTGQARAVLKFMIEGLEGNNSAHAQLLRDEMKLLADKEDYYLFHDHLSDINRPVYFYEFMEQARALGLEYLGDTDLQTMLVDNLPKQVAEKLKTSKDIVQVEQYMDFFRNRRFRHTLLCHKGNALNRNINADILHDFHLYSDVKAKEVLDEERLKDGVAANFEAMGGKLNLGTTSRLTKLVFKLMAASHGRPLTLKEIAARLAAEETGLSEERALAHMQNEMNMLHLVFSGIVKLRLSPGSYQTTVSATPRATRTARWQAGRGRIVTNARHQPLKLQPVEAIVVAQLDGSQSVDQLVDMLVEKEKQGELSIQQGGADSDEAGKRELIRRSCEDMLQRLANLAMLV